MDLFGFLEFWKLEEFVRFLDFEEIPRDSKIPKTPTQVSDFWKLEREPQNPKIEQIPRVSKTPNLGVGFFGFLEFWKFEEFARFLDFEAPLKIGFLIRAFQGFLYDSLLCFRLPIKFNNIPVHFNGSPYLMNKTPNHFNSILSDLQWDSCICLMGFVLDFNGCLLKDFIGFNIGSYSF